MNYNLTVNALLTVKAFPCITNVKKPTTATRIGDRIHKSENKTEFIRATDIISDRSKGWGRERTFDEPLELYSPRIHCTLDPLILPREELDKLDLISKRKIVKNYSRLKQEARTYGSDQLIYYRHPFIPTRGSSLLDPDTPFHDKRIERPSDDQDEEACESRPA